MTEPLRVGIAGANVQRGWARDAHFPALAKLPQFKLVAISARTQVLADEARAAYGALRAYGDSLALVRAADIDVVVVTVKVPEHRAIVLAALAAGKHVYCEWPLGRDLAEAQEMAAAVRPDRHVMIGLQGLSAPAVRHAAMLVRDGALGPLKVLRVFSPTAGWAAEAPPYYAYLQDRRNGATLATIAGGHTLAALEEIVGPYLEVDARNSILLQKVRIQGSSEMVERTCIDHMMILGKHRGGCVSSLEVIGGVPSRPFYLELVGEQGWLKLTGGHAGGYQVGKLNFETSFSNRSRPEPLVSELGSGPPANLAEAYIRFAADIRAGTRTVPDFEVAARLSKLLDKIDTASQTGVRQMLEG